MTKKKLRKKSFRDLMYMALCEMGLHKYHRRTNGGAAERVCLRCGHRELLLVRRDKGDCKYYREHKSHLTRRVLK